MELGEITTADDERGEYLPNVVEAIEAAAKKLEALPEPVAAIVASPAAAERLRMAADVSSGETMHPALFLGVEIIEWVGMGQHSLSDDEYVPLSGEQRRAWSRGELTIRRNEDGSLSFLEIAR